MAKTAGNCFVIRIFCIASLFGIRRSSLLRIRFRFWETALLLIPVKRECSFQKS
jgi:hypothetical protein